MDIIINPPPPPATHLLFILTILAATCIARASDPPTELLMGFRATPSPSASSFQPLLSDPSGNYSLGFLRVNPNRLTLSVVHVPSSVQLWSANPTHPATWGNPTQLFFNGSLVLSDPRTGVFWSTRTAGNRVYLSNTSNLVVDSWQSFDFPTDTLVENQNFTTAMALVSSNGLYSMRLGPNYMGLFANFRVSDPGPGQMYLRHGALEAKAEIIEGRPIYMVLESDGYLGMYQNGPPPVDVLPFNTFQQNVSGIRRVTLEPDGDFKGYYWTGSVWELDYDAITESCELPSACGAYGLCRPGMECSWLENRAVHDEPGDFCEKENRFRVLRKSGVDLPFKELMGYKKVGSIEECESACEVNCTCWGAVYSNSSGFCYTIDYPVQTVVAVGDETKVGYFKVWEGAGKRNVDARFELGLGLFLGVVFVFGGVVGLIWYRLGRRGRVNNKGYNVGEEESVVGVGPYKDLGSASFRSIELCER